MNRKTIALAFAGAVAFSGFADVTTYFVAKDDPVAADTNPGTEAAPFKTIQAAVDKAAAGDVIRVKPGVYDFSDIAMKVDDFNGTVVTNHPSPIAFKSIAGFSSKDESVFETEGSTGAGLIVFPNEEPFENPSEGTVGFEEIQ